MKAAALSLWLSLALVAATGAWARDSVLPAGTLITCTLDEANFSSATASVGDPVLCHPHGLQIFGQTVFPRGTYIVGHLADDKDPGHFWGKGYLKLEFDRIGLPSADLPLSAKMVAVSGGYKVDREGKIIGKGHLKRDIAEWMIPPLWPWKLIMLPARGPRPTLKGETRVTLRLMEDLLVPESGQYQRFGRMDSGTTYARPTLFMRPKWLPAPSAVTDASLYRTVSWQSQSVTKVDSGNAANDDHSGWHSFRKSSPATAPAPAVRQPPAAETTDDEDVAMPQKNLVTGTAAPAKAAPMTKEPVPTAAEDSDNALAPASAVTAVAPTVTSNSPALATSAGTESVSASSGPRNPAPKAKLTLFALKAGRVYAATDYWRDEDQLVYVLPNGKEGQVELSELDWKTTTQLNSERGVKVTLREGR